MKKISVFVCFIFLYFGFLNLSFSKENNGLPSKNNEATEKEEVLSQNLTSQDSKKNTAKHKEESDISHQEESASPHEKNISPHDELKEKYGKIIKNYLLQKKKVKISLKNFCLHRMECLPPVKKSNESAAPSKVEDGYKNEFFYKDYLLKSMINSGVSGEVANLIISKVQKLEVAKTLDKNQPEVVLKFPDYMKRVGFEVDEKNEIKYDKILSFINKKYLEHKKTIDFISENLNIERSILLALWYNETRCGNYIGEFFLLNCLYTMALDKRRSDFFEKEFIIMAKLIDSKILNIDTKASWAGAVGQLQTMPSVINRYHIVFESKDQQLTEEIKLPYHKNIGESLATGANYLYSIGFANSMPILFEVDLDEDFEFCKTATFRNKQKVADLLKKVKIKDYNYKKKLNISYKDFLELDAYIVNPDCNNLIYQNLTIKPRYFMVFDNYLSLLSWNRSNFFATSVGLITQAIREEAENENSKFNFN